MMLIQSVHFSSSSSSTTIAVAARVSSFTGHKNGHNIIQNRPQIVWSLRNRNTHKQQQKRQQLLVQRNKCCSNGSNSSSSSSSRLSSGMKKRVRVYGTRCKALSVTSEEEFEEVVMKSKVPVLVDFWASWCGPCKLVAPSMDKIEQVSFFPCLYPIPCVFPPFLIRSALLPWRDIVMHPYSGQSLVSLYSRLMWSTLWKFFWQNWRSHLGFTMLTPYVSNFVCWTFIILMGAVWRAEPLCSEPLV